MTNKYRWLRLKMRWQLHPLYRRLSPRARRVDRYMAEGAERYRALLDRLSD